MKKILLFVFLFASLIIAQSFQIKQITNLNADCRNIVRSERGIQGGSYFAFEAHIANVSSIYLGQYDAFADSFSIILNVTNDNFTNINPQLIAENDSLIIIYQTNRNGNWDIAYNVYKNNILSPVYYAANSLADEINPGVKVHFWLSGQISYLLYEKNESVLLKNLETPQVDALEIFKGDSTSKYNQATLGIYQSLYRWDYYVAAKKISDSKPSIVMKEYDGTSWGSEIIVSDSGNVDSPEDQGSYLSYNNDLEGVKNIYIAYDYSHPALYEKLILNPQHDYFNLKTDYSGIITKKISFYPYEAYAYQVSRNDSLLIRVYLNDNFIQDFDTLVNTKVTDSKLYMGLLGYNNGNGVIYTFWEDSINNHIRILGRKTLYPLGGINDNSHVNSFFLEQNYPNPFNPGTIINFKILHRDKVTLNIYDIMGRQVCTLLNEDKPAGDYNIKFDSKKYNLSSGIYFYRLITDGNSAVKKMLLLK